MSPHSLSCPFYPVSIFPCPQFCLSCFCLVPATAAPVPVSSASEAPRWAAPSGGPCLLPPPRPFSAALIHASRPCRTVPCCVVLCHAPCASGVGSPSSARSQLFPCPSLFCEVLGSCLPRTSIWGGASAAWAPPREDCASRPRSTQPGRPGESSALLRLEEETRPVSWGPRSPQTH